MTTKAASDGGTQPPLERREEEDPHHQKNPSGTEVDVFPGVDDEPPNLDDIMLQLVGNINPEEDLEEDEDETRQPNKPWLRWPTTLEDLRRSKAQRDLYGYLTNRKLLVKRTEQIREQFLTAAASSGLFTLKKESSGEEDAQTFDHEPRAAALLEGGTSDSWAYYSSDTTCDVFRQEPFFRYLFGVNEPDLYGLLDFQTKETVLFVPAVPPAAERFLGPTRPPEWYVEKYGLSKAIIYEDAAASLQEELQRRKITKIYVLKGTNSDSGRDILPPEVAFKLKVSVDDSPLLYTTLCACRVYKVPLEVAHMRASCLASSQAHVFVMKNLYEGMIELHGEILFKAFVGYAGGSRQVGYTCICCAGENGATLHYGHAGRPNDAQIKRGDMLLFDMGGEYEGYSTDITVSYPINGTFTSQQQVVYQAVFAAARQTKKLMKPGVDWKDLHRNAEQVILKHLIIAGLLRGTVNQCMRLAFGSLFMPHGLGHFIGLDTHDVGGYVGTVRSEEEGLRYLRTTRILEKHMVITVEPGCYFIKPLLDKVLQDPIRRKFINVDVLQGYMGIGGVRLEDVVVVTDEGIANLTVLPRRIGEIEELLSERPCMKTCIERMK